jgi:hypothetical protein
MFLPPSLAKRGVRQSLLDAAWCNIRYYDVLQISLLLVKKVKHVLNYNKLIRTSL